MEKDAIFSLTVDELKTKLTELGLNTTGLKRVLQDRLLLHFGLSRDDHENSFETASTAEQITVNNHVCSRRGMFTLRDIEDSLMTFDGVGHPKVAEWIENFEECALTVEWDDVQKFIYGKQLLKGAAKLFVRCEKNINSWSSLCKALIDEFGVVTSAAEVHRILRNRRKKSSESLREYLYSLMEIGKSIDLDEESLVEYFVEGIPDSRQNKSLLYQANTLSQLKVQIQAYERVRGSSMQTGSRTNYISKGPVSSENKRCDQIEKKCFKCGEVSHLAKNCSSRHNMKCFSCGQLGHRVAECPSREQKKQGTGKSESNVHTATTVESLEVPETQITLAIGCNRIFKDFCLNGQHLSALFDTGSDLNLLRFDSLLLLEKVELSKVKRILSGIGQKRVVTLGCFETKVTIDELELVLTFHVVGESDIPYSAVIGNEVLKQVDVEITTEGAVFKSKVMTEKPNECESKPILDGSRSQQASVKVSKVGRAGSRGCVGGDRGNIGREYLDRRGDTCQGLEVLRRKGCGDARADEIDSSIAGELLKELCAICLSAGDGEFARSDDFDLGHLRYAEEKMVRDMIESYVPEKRRATLVEMRLVLKDEIPVYQRPRRLAYSDQQIVEKQVADWIREGIVQPSTSEYASPIVLVQKRDGTKRLCCDYRKLNEKIIRDNFPMVLIDDVMDRLQGAKVFTTLDLTNGFFHVPVEKNSRKYTSFVTHHGQFEFLYVPFGISNSPAVFCRYISSVFRSLIQDGTVVVYMDDLIIPSMDEDDGLEKLAKVLKVAEKNGMSIQWKKCQFLRRKIDFLGYIVENNTIRPSLEKTRAIEEFPIPKDLKSLQRFLGLTSYFRRFVDGFAMVAKPLSDLMKKNVPFKIGVEQLVAFEQLKKVLVNAPVLQLFDPKATTEVHTDACMYGYGAVLLQKNVNDQNFHPIQYMSRKTTPAEEKLHSYELEVLAIVEALKKWRVYVMGVRLKIVTDCNAFAMTMKKVDVPLRVSRWAMFLQEFDYIIEHRSATKMKHVDALSRVWCMMIDESLNHRIREAQSSDAWKRVIDKRYNLNELVAIKRNQYGIGKKLRPKVLVPYKITKIRKHSRYKVQKVGNQEGPASTTTVAEYMKEWSGHSRSNELSGQPGVGSGRTIR